MVQGDVYHLVFELGEWLDGRVWSRSDELDVLRLMDFIEHVIGAAHLPLVLAPAAAMLSPRERECGLACGSIEGLFTQACV